jgi:hypothetical protein
MRVVDLRSKVSIEGWAVRRRSLFLGGIVAVIALVAAGFGTDHWLAVRHRQQLLDAQQVNYTAGHTAYLAGDCPTARPLMQKVDVPNLDPETAGKARTEHAACQEFQEVKSYADRLPPSLALIPYLQYLKSTPDAPLAAAAGRAARPTVRAGLKKHTVNIESCQGKNQALMAKFGILRLKPSDPLAAPFLRACAQEWGKNNYWPQARGTYLQLQRDFPTTAQGRSSLKDLVTASFTQARRLLKKDMDLPTSGWPDASLHGKTAFQITYNRPVEVSTRGPKTSFVQLKTCKGCRPAGNKVKTYAQCVKIGKTKKIVLPPGKYQLQVRFVDESAKATASRELNGAGADDGDVLAGHSRRFRANHTYKYCVWSE